MTYRTQIEGAAGSIEAAEALLQGPPFERTLAEGWVLFDEVALARTGTGFGLAPISYAEMMAWSRLTRTKIRPWHVAVMRALDVTFLSAMAVEDKDINFSKLATADDPSPDRP